MKKFEVNVDGEVFQVSVKEVEGGNEEVTTTVEKTTPKPQPTQTPTTASTDDVEGEKVEAALPGVISSVEVNLGDTVSEGDVLFIHEAMKMENEITAHVSGTVKKILVSAGDNVDTNEVLAIIG